MNLRLWKKSVFPEIFVQLFLIKTTNITKIILSGISDLNLITLRYLKQDLNHNMHTFVSICD